MRVHELAKELGLKSQELLERIQREGLDVKDNALASLDPAMVDRIRALMQAAGWRAGSPGSAPRQGAGTRVEARSPSGGMSAATAPGMTVAAVRGGGEPPRPAARANGVHAGPRRPSRRRRRARRIRPSGPPRRDAGTAGAAPSAAAGPLGPAPVRRRPRPPARGLGRGSAPVRPSRPCRTRFPEAVPGRAVAAALPGSSASGAIGGRRASSAADSAGQGQRSRSGLSGRRRPAAVHSPGIRGTDSGAALRPGSQGPAFTRPSSRRAQAAGQSFQPLSRRPGHFNL